MSCLNLMGKNEGLPLSLLQRENIRGLLILRESNLGQGIKDSITLLPSIPSHQTIILLLMNFHLLLPLPLPPHLLLHILNLNLTIVLHHPSPPLQLLLILNCYFIQTIFHNLDPHLAITHRMALHAMKNVLLHIDCFLDFMGHYFICLHPFFVLGCLQIYPIQRSPSEVKRLFLWFPHTPWPVLDIFSFHWETQEPLLWYHYISKGITLTKKNSFQQKPSHLLNLGSFKFCLALNSCALIPSWPRKCHLRIWRKIFTLVCFEFLAFFEASFPGYTDRFCHYRWKCHLLKCSWCCWLIGIEKKSFL